MHIHMCSTKWIKFGFDYPMVAIQLTPHQKLKVQFGNLTFFVMQVVFYAPSSSCGAHFEGYTWI